MLISRLASPFLAQPVTTAKAKGTRFSAKEEAPVTPQYRVIITTAVPDKNLLDAIGNAWNRVWSVPESEQVVYRLPSRYA